MTEVAQAIEETTTTKPKRTKAGDFRELEGVKRSGELYDIDPRIIVTEEGFNARNFELAENEEHVDTLAKSIASVGLRKPLTVRYADGKVILVDGESRLKGTLRAIDKYKAEIATVKAYREDSRTSEAERVLGLFLDNGGKNLNLLEQADVFVRLHNFGWNDAKIAKAIGKTGAHVSSVMKLHTSPEEVKTLVRTGKVSGSFAIDTIREVGPDKAADTLKEAIAEANLAGKETASKKHTKAAKEAKKAKKSTPICYQREIVNSFIDLLVEIANDTAQPRGIRKKAKDTLENADINPKGWFEEEEAA